MNMTTFTYDDNTRNVINAIYRVFNNDVERIEFIDDDEIVVITSYSSFTHINEFNQTHNIFRFVNDANKNDIRVFSC
jgi:hypothetical protein